MHWQSRQVAGCFALTLALAVGMACKKQEPVVIDARAVVPVAAVDLAVTATPPTLPTVSPPPSTGEEPTIELSGTVQMGPAGRPRYPLSVIIASGDCASPSSRLLRRVPLGDSDGFFAVVMADPGEQLTICIASEPAPGMPTPLWTRSEPITVGKTSEQSFSNLSLVMRSAEPKSFAVKARSK